MAEAICGSGLMVKFYMVVVELHKMEVWALGEYYPFSPVPGVYKL
jgi:hypothetical protein